MGLKYKFRNRHFLAEGYCVLTVGLNESAIRKYIEEQEQHDIARGKSGNGNRLDCCSVILAFIPCTNHPFDGWFWFVVLKLKS